MPRHKSIKAAHYFAQRNLIQCRYFGNCLFFLRELFIRAYEYVGLPKFQHSMPYFVPPISYTYVHICIKLISQNP